MALFELELPWDSQPQGAVWVDWRHPSAAGIERAIIHNSARAVDVAKGTPLTYGSTPLTLSASPAGIGVSSALLEPNSSIGIQPWNNTGEASVLLVQSRRATIDNTWHNLTTSASGNHFPYGGLYYTGAFHATRYINGIAAPAGKSPTVPHVIVITVKAGEQRVYWDGVLWGSASAAAAATLPASLVLNYFHSITGTFDGGMFASVFWSRALSSSEARELGSSVSSAWQLFEPQSIPIYVAAGGGAPAESGGSSAAVTVTAAGAGAATEAASGGASAAVTATAAGAGTAAESASGGAGSTVTVSAAGAGTAADGATGGSSASVAVSAAGSGTAAEAASSGAAAAVSISAAGAGTAVEAATGGASAAVSISAVGAGTGADGQSGWASATVTTTATGAGTATEQASGGAGATVLVTAVGGAASAADPTAQFDSGAADYIAAVNRNMAAREIERQNQMIIQFVMAAVTSGALQ